MTSKQGQPSFCFMRGQFAKAPFKAITIGEVYESLFTAPSVPKANAPAVIMSSLLTRTFAEHKERGVYWGLALDIDEAAPSMLALVRFWEALTDGCNAVCYTTASATPENPKVRLIAFLAKPMAYAEWVIAARILNDKAKAAGIIPDRATERAGQLIFLPNRGKHFDYYFWRDNKLLDPHKLWVAEYEAEERRIQEAAQEAERLRRESEIKRAQFDSSGRDSVIAAFNRANPIENILLRAGYDRQGSHFRHPNSKSGNFSASVKDGRVFTLSPNDMLYGEHAHDSFGAACVLFFGGDMAKTMAAVKESMRKAA